MNLRIGQRSNNNGINCLVDRKLWPMLLEHPDPECRIYGQMLCENRLGPHALRHWFSVQLALRGEDVAQLINFPPFCPCGKAGVAVY